MVFPPIKITVVIMEKAGGIDSFPRTRGGPQSLLRI
jgi:hypothetical protein